MKFRIFIVALVLSHSVALTASLADENSASFLLGTQNLDGGWGMSRGSPSTVADTSMALMALLRSGENFKSSRNAEKMRRAKEYLIFKIKESDDTTLKVPNASPLIAGKLGPDKDLFFATWALSEALEKPLSVSSKKEITAAIKKSLKKMGSAAFVEKGSKGTVGRSSYFGGELGTAVVIKALERAISVGVLPNQILKNSLTNLNPDANRRSSMYSLYDSASALSIRHDIELIKAMLEGRRTFSRRSKELDAAFNSLSGIAGNSQFISGFGSLGGEEVLSYMLISEALAIRGGEPFNKWQKHIKSVIDRDKNPDGSIVGKHCIGGTTFPTAAYILTKTAGKAPQVPKELVTKPRPSAPVTNREDVSAKIMKYRDSKGKKNTELLVELIKRLNGEPRKKAQKALVDRMCRMSAATLQKKISSSDAEIQRAAIKAIAKNQKVELSPHLIDLLTDDDVKVRKDAVDALRAFSGSQFGYDPEGSLLSKISSQKRWKRWWDAR